MTVAYIGVHIDGCVRVCVCVRDLIGKLSMQLVPSRVCAEPLRSALAYLAAFDCMSSALPLIQTSEDLYDCFVPFYNLLMSSVTMFCADLYVI